LQIARQSTLLTHSNKKGFNGAILQALAIYRILQSNPDEKLSVEEYIKSLKEVMLKLEKSPTKMDNE